MNYLWIYLLLVFNVSIILLLFFIIMIMIIITIIVITVIIIIIYIYSFWQFNFTSCASEKLTTNAWQPVAPKHAVCDEHRRFSENTTSGSSRRSCPAPGGQVMPSRPMIRAVSGF